MSIGSKIAFGAAAGWVSRCVSILLGLLLMPALFRHLPREELGVWLLLGQSWATLGILDLGLGVTLTRRIAFAVGRSGVEPGGILSAESLADIKDLVETGRRLYRILAITSFCVAFGLGYFSLRAMHLSSVGLFSAWFAWGVLCLAQALGVWASIWNCVLQGTGYVGWDALIAALVNSLILMSQILVAIFGGGLIGLAVVAALGVLVQRFLILGFARRKRPELFSLGGSWRSGLLRSMAPFALKAWITSVSVVVILNSDQYFIAALRGASQIPDYRAAYIVFYNLNLIAVAFATSSSVFIAQLWQAGEIDRIHRIVTHNLRLGMSIMAVGGACVLALGPRLFNVWIGHGNYIGPGIATIFFVLLLLEVQSFIIATSSRATEDEAFAVCVGVAALLNIGLSIVLGMRYGLIGIAMATLVAQLCTSYWFMCYRGLRRLKMSLRYHAKMIVVPIAALFVVSFGAIKGLNLVFSSVPDVAAVAMSMGLGAVLLSVTFWFFVFDPPRRQYAAALPGKLLRFALR